MADMRLIVAGAGGRMGRTLVKAIAETKGLALAGAVDAPGSRGDRPRRGRAGGAAANGIKLTADLAPLLANADGIDRFHHSRGDRGACRLTARRKVHIIGTTGHSRREREADQRRPPRAP